MKYKSPLLLITLFLFINSSLYHSLKVAGVLQYHFFLPNNESFYRAHKPSKFGDDLTEIREDVKYINETKKIVRAFVQGRVAYLVKIINT